MPERGVGQALRDITAYLILAVAISTVGSLQYGYHLVCPSLMPRRHVVPRPLTAELG